MGIPVTQASGDLRRLRPGLTETVFQTEDFPNEFPPYSAGLKGRFCQPRPSGLGTLSDIPGP